MPNQSSLNDRIKTRFLAQGTPSYSLAATKTNGITDNTILAGFPIEIPVVTSNLSSGTTLYYTLTGFPSSAIVGGSLSGSFAITGSTTTVSILTALDYGVIVDYTGTFQLRTGSTSGDIVATSATITITPPPSVAYGPVAYTIVGGGGGGGSDFGGGGAGGGIYSGQLWVHRDFNHSVTIAAGGARGSLPSGTASTGGVSSWFPYYRQWKACGGGAGGKYNSTNGTQGIGSGEFTNSPGASGGAGGGGNSCGGGGFGAAGAVNATYFPNGVGAVYQNVGGNGYAGGNYAGGGGGAGGIGSNGPGSSSAGVGGVGVADPILGNTYCAGGGGGACSGGTLNNGGSNGIGGSGGGAQGLNDTIYSTSGTVNTGSGGGGGGATGANAGLGGNGGSGVCVLRTVSSWAIYVATGSVGLVTLNFISNVGGVKSYTVTAGSGNLRIYNY